MLLRSRPLIALLAVSCLTLTVAACDSETCRWQIEGATGVRTRHPVEILADAYRAYDRAATAAASPGTAPAQEAVVAD